jgi:glycosyltransferase involved in cell wall biosynthesis
MMPKATSPLLWRSVPRCIIFNPAFPVLGGGERYTLALGSIISETHDVTYAAGNAPDPARVAQLGFEPFDVEEIDEQDFSRVSKEFDLAVVVTLGLPPRSFASKSLLVVQFPRGMVAESSTFQSWRNARTLRRYQAVVYSEYARHWLQQRWDIDGVVLMPGVELGTDGALRKENLILSVARFVGAFADDWNNKRQDILIEAFSHLPSDLRQSWNLVLAGACSPSKEMEDFVDALRQKAAGLNISIETNITPERLTELQRRARLFWHATGYGRDPSEPERAEHFGMSTVEAMSYGAIPLVYADGGQLEIVDNAVGGLWRSIPELVEQSTALMMRPPAELDDVSRDARSASTRFGSARFEAEARDLLVRLGVRRSAPDPQPTVRLAARARRAARWATYRSTAPLLARAARVVATARRRRART